MALNTETLQEISTDELYQYLEEYFYGMRRNEDNFKIVMREFHSRIEWVDTLTDTFEADVEIYGNTFQAKTVSNGPVTVTPGGKVSRVLQQILDQNV